MRFSGFIRPFGFVRNELESDDELDHAFEADPLTLVLTYAVLLAADLLTLPLALLCLVGAEADS